MKPKSMLTWRLLFRNSDMEKQYFESKFEYQKMVLDGSILVGILIIVLSLAINPFNRSYSSFDFLGIKIIGMTLVIPLYFISKRWPKYRENILFFIFTMTFFFLSESRKKYILILGKSYTFTCGMFIQLVLLALTVSKIGMLKRSLLIIIANILSCFFYLPYEENYNESFYSFYHFCLNLIVLLIFSYSLEKYDRTLYFEIKKRELTLSSFKDLINDLFPSPVVIIQGDSVLFENKEALINFESQNKSELIESLKKIKVQKNNDDKSLYNEKYFTTDNLLLKDDGADNNDKYISFWNIIHKYTYLEPDLDRRHVQTLMSFQIDPSSGVKKYYDVKIKIINWEEKMAIMLIFSENKMIKRIHKLNEQALYKDRLLATVSHDLRTPLNGIMGMLELTLELVLDKNVQKNLSIALRSSNYLLSMINDILDFQQISIGKLRLNYEIFSLIDLINEVSKMVKFQAKRKNIDFKIENKLNHNNSKAIIKSDPNRIKQVMLNLIGNAFKFTEKGSITISIERNFDNKELQVQPEEEIEYYIIRVTDTGSGIKEEDQKKLFKLFGKLESDDKKILNDNGVGLGLAISQNLVMILNDNKQNYRINVTSEYGKGSSFYFPLVSGLEEIERESLMTGQVEDKINDVYVSSISTIKKSKTLNHKQNHKILIVDDDQINIIVAKAYLQTSGFQTYDIANNGLEALQKIQSNAENGSFYDIILMDCNMPVMSGYEATQEIRELIQQHKIPDLKIIACTANSSQKDYEEIFRVGMNDYISKPFTRNDLVEKILLNMK